MILLRMTLTGTVPILLVAAFRLLFRDRVHRSVFPTLWTVISLRMLVPFFLPVSISVASKEAVPSLIRKADTIRTTAEQSVTAAAKQAPDLSGILLTVWLIGAAACLLFFLGTHLRSRLRYRFSLPLPDGIADTEGLRVRMLDELDGPLTYGIFRPTVLLPVSLCYGDSKTLSHILIHEKVHIRCLDLPRKAILLFVTALHWFNPFAWLMLYLASQDMEIRCDAKAVSILGNRTKKDYARTLIDIEQHRFDLLQAGFSFNRTLTRLKALSKAKVSKWITACIALCLSAVLLICCLSPTLCVASPMLQNIFSASLPVPETFPARKTPSEIKKESISAPIEEPAEEEVEADEASDAALSSNDPDSYIAPPASYQPDYTVPTGSYGDGFAACNPTTDGYVSPPAYTGGYVSTYPYNYDSSAPGPQPCIPGVYIQPHVIAPVISLDPPGVYWP
mgnify:CR=1 FL=1